MNNWLRKVYHLHMHTWQKHVHEATTGNKSSHRTIKSNEDHITQLAYLFLPFLLQLCNDVLLQYFRCKVKSSHVARSILTMSYLESFKQRSQSTKLVILIISMRKMTHKIVSVFIIYTIVCFIPFRVYILCGPNNIC